MNLLLSASAANLDCCYCNPEPGRPQPRLGKATRQLNKDSLSTLARSRPGWRSSTENRPGTPPSSLFTSHRHRSPAPPKAHRQSPPNTATAPQGIDSEPSFRTRACPHEQALHRPLLRRRTLPTASSPLHRLSAAPLFSPLPPRSGCSAPQQPSPPQVCVPSPTQCLLATSHGESGGGGSGSPQS